MYTFDAGGDFFRFKHRSMPRAISSVISIAIPGTSADVSVCVIIVAGTVIRWAERLVVFCKRNPVSPKFEEGRAPPPAASAPPLLP